MRGIRAFLMVRPGLAALLFAVALTMKLAVPGGTMIDTRSLTVTLCSGMGAAETVTIPFTGKKDDAKGAADGPCAFASLGDQMLGGADAPLLAAAIAFILLLGVRPRAAPEVNRPAFLRPPLRAPPVI